MSFAKTHRSIWNDVDFRERSPFAKLLYWHLMSHPKLSRCGVVDIRVDRWSRAIGITEPEVEEALRELVATRYVFVDEMTEELAIRTYVKADGFEGNWQLVKAMWRAWEGVESDSLRAQLVASFPQAVFDHRKAVPPPQAQITKQQVDGSSIERATGHPMGHQETPQGAMPPAFPTFTSTATATATETRQSAPDEPTAEEQLANVHTLRDRLGGTSA